MRNIFDEIDPLNKNGADLVVILKNFKDSLMSGLKGPGKPDQVTEGGSWVDDTFEAAPDYRWDYKLFTGDQNVTIFSINTQSGLVSFPGTGNTFDIKKVSNDAAGPELTFLKERVSFNGQVKAGDSLGDVLFKGKDDTGATRVSARVRVSSLQDFLATEWGSEIILDLVDKDGTVLQERVRIGEKVLEVKKSFKAEGVVLSQRTQALAVGSSEFISLVADASVIIFTGTEPGVIKGVSSTGHAKSTYLYNTSTQPLTLAHESLDAVAADRLNLPNAEDLVVLPGTGASIFYQESTTRWNPTVTPATGGNSPSMSPLNLLANPLFKESAPDFSVTSGTGTITSKETAGALVTAGMDTCGKFVMGAASTAKFTSSLAAGELDGNVKFEGFIKTPVDLEVSVGTHITVVPGYNRWEYFKVVGPAAAAVEAVISNTLTGTYYLSGVYFGPEGDRSVVFPSLEQSEVDALKLEESRSVFNTDTKKVETSFKNVTGVPAWNPVVHTAYQFHQLALTNGGSIALDEFCMHQVIPVRGNAGAVTLDTDAPFFMVGFKKHGQRVTLIGGHDTNTVLIPKGAMTNKAVLLRLGSTATYVWNGVESIFELEAVSTYNEHVAMAALDINWLAGSVYSKSVAVNSSITFSNVQEGKVISLVVHNTSGADITLTLPTLIKRTDFTAVVKAGKRNVYTFLSTGPSTIYASCVDEMA